MSSSPPIQPPDSAGRPPPVTNPTSTTLVASSDAPGTVTQTFQPPRDSTSTDAKPDTTQTWLFYVLHMSGAILLLVAPWIFYGLLVKHDHYVFSHRRAEAILKNPRITTVVVVSIAGLVSTGVTFVFAASVACVAQKWITSSATRPPPVLDSKGTFIRNPERYPVRIEYLGHLAHVSSLKPVTEYKSWRGIAISAVAFIIYGIGNQALAGISAVLTPQAVNLTTPFTGAELDFASSNPTCLEWYSNNTLPQSCSYTTVNGFTLTDCLGETQLIDVIQAGRDNAALTRSSIPTTFPRMNSTRFLGAFPGVLLAGPNGLNDFSQVSPRDPEAFFQWPTPGLSYNYTHSLQGVTPAVNCAYQDNSPIKFHLTVNENPTWVNWTASCPSGTSQFVDPADGVYQTIPSELSMAMWACKDNSSYTTDGALSYLVYLYGVAGYGDSINNMTCTVNVTLANYEIEYLGGANYFRTIQPPMDERISNRSNVFANVFDEVVRRGVDIGFDAQTTTQGNLVAEAIFGLGAEYYGLNQTSHDDRYPNIAASILQGMLGYQAGYLRFIYASDEGLPSQCLRDLNGVVSYSGVGWSTGSAQFHPAFLAAYTVLLLLTLILFSIALCMPIRRDGWDPTDPTQVALAACEGRLRNEGNQVKELKKDILLVSQSQPKAV